MLGCALFPNFVASCLLLGGALAQYQLPRPELRCDEKVWPDIGDYLKDRFIDERGGCTQLAAQAVRLPFHDCFPDGGCDGSIILTDECTSRSENKQMIPICQLLYQIYRDKHVGAADLINFAASMANKACPWGPFIPFYVGRRDNRFPAPPDQIPSDQTSAQDLLALFANKEFLAVDLVALLGAHSVGGNLSHVPFDHSPEAMESPQFYTEVLIGEAPAILASDKSIALDPATTDLWQLYARDQRAWDTAYIAGMTKMIVRENNILEMLDCSNLVHDAFEGGEDYDYGDEDRYRHEDDINWDGDYIWEGEYEDDDTYYGDDTESQRENFEKLLH